MTLSKVHSRSVRLLVPTLVSTLLGLFGCDGLPLVSGGGDDAATTAPSDLSSAPSDLAKASSDLTPAPADMTPASVDMALAPVDMSLAQLDMSMQSVDLMLDSVDLTMPRADLAMLPPDLSITVDLAIARDGMAMLPDGMPPSDMTVYNPRNQNGAGPAAVDIGSANDPAAAAYYILLAKTGITNVTGSKIVGGNLGLSPASAAFITGFSLIADQTNVFSTSSSVMAPGKVYAANYAVPTPTNLTTAVLKMQAAYNDAAGRTTPDFLNLNGGNLGGLILAPGLYTWGTTVTIPGNVTLFGGANDVWIFQISGDLDLSTAKQVILAGGALPKNIFWQVAGAAALHVNSHFEGIILCKSGITLQTKASMNGRALAQTLVAIDDNAVTAP